MDELQQLRQKRLAELQQQSGGGGAGPGGAGGAGQQQQEEQKRQQQEELKNTILTQVLTQEARARCKSICQKILKLR